ncbi:metalloregulator ArsR/SmtB family transcription factor [Thermococcus sp.]|uniref:ArsR/SmtB family transcription factor n=1 Tax=Thermococcus sp. TaxID=35749 RepID=UPI002619A8A0|nr:metalloregulator ArsR/SmtB family transcription factor [Thermococcus sp.]
MKVGDVLNKLNEKQRKTVARCSENCGILDVDAEINTEVNEETVRFLKALSNPIRLKILKMLRGRWLCVCIISAALEQDQTLISHHLRTLKSVNLIESRKEGKMHFYRTNEEVLRKHLELLSGELMGE